MSPPPSDVASCELCLASSSKFRRRRLCRSCYRKLSEHGLPMPLSGQRERKFREWAERLDRDTRETLARAIDTVRRSLGECG